MSLTVAELIAQVSALNENVSGNHDNLIYGVKLWDSRDLPAFRLSPGTLYLAAPGALRPERASINVAIIPQENMLAAMAEISSVLQIDYHRMDDLMKLQQAITRNEDGEQIIALCRKILGNPVWIFNAQMEPLAFSVSEERLPHPVSPEGFVRHVAASPAVYESDAACPCRRVVGKITHFQKTIGFLIMLNLEDTFGRVNEEIYITRICNFLSYWEPLMYLNTSKMAQVSFMVSLLHGHITDPSVIRQQMARFHMPAYDKYYLLLIDRTEQEQLIPVQEEISQCLGQTVYCYGRYYFALLGCDIRQTMTQDYFLPLLSLLQGKHMHISLSNGFLDMVQIHEAFNQALACLLPQNHPMDIVPPFSCYEDIMFSQLFRQWSGQAEISLSSMCHPTLMSLLNYDKSHNTEYFKTLTILLFHNMDLNSVANYLYVHRNTLYKRMQWIERNYYIALSNTWEILKMQISILMIDYLNLGPAELHEWLSVWKVPPSAKSETTE